MQQDEHARAGFRHAITVRYGECDMQGVVFNANYLAYADDVCDRWMTAALGKGWNVPFDAMVKKTAIEWHAAARHGETIDFSLDVMRWGNSSMDVRISGAVRGQPVVTVDLVYVSVTPGSHSPRAIPPVVREALEAATR